ncbi:prevent-host-death protein [Paraburkholderia panacisoli]|uniref:Prevent-host-death protein n=1 Tax=Paraburkholderia panacisoli TaxID=2603818 RepID=A0A5B0HI59_9BURK|nr:prevent-host-death protein [Paraburkholderia panacisoli]KAA1014861.1 prevent-host-death protein [Paraburkholderia panacisoli]
MKKTMLSTLRVAPELLMAVESVLRENESLEEFMETALRECVSRRRFQSGFIARGLASVERAHRDNEFFNADDVHSELTRRLVAAKDSPR